MQKVFGGVGGAILKGYLCKLEDVSLGEYENSSYVDLGWFYFFICFRVKTERGYKKLGHSLLGRDISNLFHLKDRDSESVTWSYDLESNSCTRYLWLHGESNLGRAYVFTTLGFLNDFNNWKSNNSNIKDVNTVQSGGFFKRLFSDLFGLNYLDAISFNCLELYVSSNGNYWCLIEETESKIIFVVRKNDLLKFRGYTINGLLINNHDGKNVVIDKSVIKITSSLEIVEDKSISVNDLSLFSEGNYLIYGLSILDDHVRLLYSGLKMILLIFIIL